MDPFELSLNQVNVMEQELGQSTDYESLYSFSNLVSYDSDFKHHEDTHAVPVLPMKVHDTFNLSRGLNKKSNHTTTSVSELIQAEATEHYLKNFRKSQSSQSAAYNPASEGPILSQYEIDLREFRDRKVQYGKGEGQTKGNHRQLLKMAPQDVVVNANINHKPSRKSSADSQNDSFHAFTETVEALALQQSVIGDRERKPASAEEIEAAIEATRLLMKQSQPSPSQGNPSIGPGPTAESTPSKITTTKCYNMNESPTSDSKPIDLDDEVPAAEDSSEEEASSSLSSSLLVPSADTLSQQTSLSDSGITEQSPTEDPASPPSNQLIRMPQDQITTVIEKASWFTANQPTSPNNDRTAVESKKLSHSNKSSKPKNLGRDKKHKKAEQNNNDSPQPINGDSSLDSVDDISAVSPVKIKSLLDSNQNSLEEPSNESAVVLPSPSSTPPKHVNSIAPIEPQLEVTPDSYHSPTTCLKPQEIHQLSSHLLETEQSLPESISIKDLGSISISPNLKSSGVEDSVTAVNPKPVSYFNFGKNLTADALSQQCERLLKERARLEGQVEFLEMESKTALQERAQLQSQVAALTQTLKSQEATSRNVSHERDAVVADYETLRQNRGRLEQVIMSAQKLLEDKDVEIKTINEDVRIAKEEMEASLSAQKALKEEMLSRDNTVGDLKSKVAELYVEFQTTNQNKILAESEITSLRSELRTVSTGKEWYMEQLEKAQEGRSALQGDITQLKREMIGQATMIERLKADNVRLKQQLASTEQRALVEKEQLARHLEAIEADMLDREAAFAQIKRDRESVETLLQSRLEQGQELPPDIEEELEKSKQDASRFEGQLKMAETEKTDLAKRLAMTQENMSQREQMVDSLQQQIIDIENRLQQSHLTTGEKEAEMDKLKEDYLACQVELSSTKEEKKSFDQALRTLKSDMGKVETSFRQMKSELGSKEEEIKSLKEEQEKLKGEVIRSVQVHTLEAAKPIESEQTQGSSEEDKEELRKNALKIEELHFEKTALEEERNRLRELIKVADEDKHALIHTGNNKDQDLELVRRQLGEMEKSFQKVANEKADLEGQFVTMSAMQAGQGQELLVLMEKLQVAEAAVEKQAEQHQAELDALSSNLRLSSETLQQSQRQHLQTLQEVEEQVQVADKQLQEERALHSRELQQVMKDLELVNADRATQSQLAARLQVELGQSQEALVQEREGYERKLEDFMMQMRGIEERSDKSDLEKALQEMTVQLQQGQHSLQQEKATHGMKMLEVEAALQEGEAARRQLEAEYVAKQQEVEEVMVVVKEMREEATREAERLVEKLEAAVQERTKQLEAELLNVHGRVDGLASEKSDLEHQLNEAVRERESMVTRHSEREKELEEEMQQARSQTGDLTTLMEERQEMILMLERERGRVAGIQQSYQSLKEHSSRLEEALAHRESSVVELSSHADVELQRKDRQLEEVRERLTEVEDTLKEEKQHASVLKQKLTEEKEGHTESRRQAESLTHSLAQLEHDIGQMNQRLDTLAVDLEKSRERESGLKEELQRVTSDSVHVRQEKDRLKTEVEENTAKDMLTQQQLKTVEWQVSEKESEIRALREQVAITETRQDMEASSLKQALQAANSELGSLRQNVSQMKTENKSLQAKMAGLREALTASVQHATLIHQETKHASAPPLDLSAIECLLHDSDSSTRQSKPLSVLQQMLGSLRGEISSLQSQVEQHTSAANSSSQAWHELEAQVSDLRAVCKSSAADREASKNLLADTMLLTQPQTDTEWQPGSIIDT